MDLADALVGWLAADRPGAADQHRAAFSALRQRRSPIKQS